MLAADPWQTWRRVQFAREQLERHLESCPECRRWAGKPRLWIQAGRLTPLPLCAEGSQLARAWNAELYHAHARRSGSRLK